MLQSFTKITFLPTIVVSFDVWSKENLQHVPFHVPFQHKIIPRPFYDEFTARIVYLISGLGLQFLHFPQNFALSILVIHESFENCSRRLNRVGEIDHNKKNKPEISKQEHCRNPRTR